MKKMFPGLPTRFESQRLVLRPYQAGDGPMYFAVGQKNRQHLQRYEADNAVLSAKTEQEAEALVQELAIDWAVRNCFFLGAFDKLSAEFVAQVYIGVVNWDTPEFEVGFFVDQDHEGQGYVAEAVRTALGFVFDHLHAQRVSLRCDTANTRSQRVAERCGFAREGRLRQVRRQPDGSFSDAYIYGLLRSEWQTKPGRPMEIAMMNSSAYKQTVFMTTVRTPYGRQRAGWMIDSLRTFGGLLANSPVWLFEAGPRAECRNLSQDGLTVIPLQVPETLKHALFSEKVFACAQAEAMAGPAVGSLVWIDPGCMVVQPPLLYVLDEEFDAAFRPVHIQNVGLRVDQPLDAFWRGIYAAVGLTDVSTTVQSFVDRQTLRPYYNSHAFALNPALGLLGRWWEHFQALACDAAFQQTACQDEPHQVFLFQALLSALLVKEIGQARLRLLPPQYNYPFNLQARVPAAYRARALNDAVTFAYEDRSLNPAEVTDIIVEEPLRSWLATHCTA